MHAEIYSSHVVRWRMAFAAVLALFLLCIATSHAQAASGPLLPPGVKLNLPSLIFGDEFGHSIAIDGDTLVVSAWRTDVGSAKQQGVVYVFERDSHDPLLFNVVKTLTASDGHEFHGFGSAVAIDGDTIVVGAIYDSDNNHFQAGAAYIFERNRDGDNAWGQVKKLVDVNFNDQNRVSGYLGSAIAIHGDTVIVGAPENRGKAFIFERNKGGSEQWGQTQELDPPTFGEGGSYGAALLFDGNRIVVAASLASMVAGRFNDEGAAFVYEHDATGWVKSGKLFVADNDPQTEYGNNSRFGQALAMSGDLIYVGAPSMKLGDVLLAGEVYIFQHDSNGDWTHIGTITPTDSAFNDSFGSALYAVSDGVFIASNKGINGTVYFYRQGGQSATAQASAASAPIAWTEAYSFTTTDDVSKSRFGQPLTGSDNTFVVGASAYNASQGSVFTYPLDQMLAFSPTAPTAKGLAYLPLVSNINALIPIKTVSGKISNNQILSGPSGFKIGAVANALTKTVTLAIATVNAPDTPLPNGVSAQSANFQLSGDKNLLLDPDVPFVVSLPVPANADKTHLALAYLQPPGEARDAEASEPAWVYLPGAYDADHNLFLAKLPFLKADGANLLLVDNPDMDSPLNTPAAQSATTQLHPFSAFCYVKSFPKPSDCTSAMEGDVKSFMDSVWLGMVTKYNFPPKLRLLDSGSQFIVSETYSVTDFNATYAVNLVYKGSNSLCEKGDVAGSYNPELGFLLVCLDKNERLSDESRQVLIHEFFHAIQYTYLMVMADRQQQEEQDWIIEGMATSAMLSYSATVMSRTGFYGISNLHKVDMPLTQGTSNDEILDEYLAQDFWVYLGQVQHKNLGYLGPLLSEGGSNVDDIAHVIDGFGADPDAFGDRYWGWVRNQAIEHTFGLGFGLGPLCTLSDDALISGLHSKFSSTDVQYPLDTEWDTLQPLTAKVIEILVPHTDNAIIVDVRYHECDGISDPDQQRACIEKQQKLLHAKIYAEGEAQCDSQTLPGTDPIIEGHRNLDPINHATRYFVIVANADLHNPHDYQIVIE